MVQTYDTSWGKFIGKNVWPLFCYIKWDSPWSLVWEYNSKWRRKAMTCKLTTEAVEGRSLARTHESTGIYLGNRRK